MSAALLTPADPSLRGYRPAYTSGCSCPGCGRSSWYVGRSSAECGFCATVLPLGPARRAAA